MSQTLTLGRAATVPVDRERAVITFISIELFILIYLQRITLLPSSFPLMIPMLAMLGGLAWMVLTKQMTFSDPRRVVAYLFFVAFCLISQAFVGGSLPSLIQLCVLYACVLVTAPISREGYETILRRFIAFMVLPAILIFAQYWYQKITGQPNFISLNKVLPQSVLAQGYFYEAHYPWYATFTRPNGFFLMEPSYASAFVAAALIVEITYFRRLYMIALMLGALIFTLGATGMSMLALAVPFLLLREKPVTIVLATSLLVITLATCFITDTPIPVLSRTGEMKSESSSGSERLLLPAKEFAELIFDPSYLIMGEGSGSAVNKAPVNKDGTPKTNVTIPNPWPMVKILHEYGLLSMIAYTLLFMLVIAGNFNLPLKFALSIEFLFTGGYLVNPPFLGLMVFLFFAVSPIKARR